MKRYIVVSIILHALIIGIALFLIPPKKEKGPKPFIARLVTPEDSSKQDNKLERNITPGEMRPRQRTSPDDRLFLKDKQTPKVLSSVPSSPSAKKSPLGPQALTRELPSRGGHARQAPDTGGDKGLREGKDLARSDKSMIPGQQQAPMRDKLFDRDIIAKLSKKEQEGTKQGSQITFDTTEFKYYGYMQLLKQKIESTWIYPPEAAAKGLYGDLEIQFTIKKNGELGAVELLRTSGYKILDDAAMKALRDAAPYWSPANIGKDSLTIPAHFIYINGNYYLR